MKIDKKFWRKLGTAFLNIILILFMIFLYDTIGFWRSIGLYLGVYLIYFIIILIRKREQVLNIIKYIETKIWGKPLSKGFWDKGELSKKKYKVVWRKPE